MNGLAYWQLPGRTISNPLGCEHPAWWLHVKDVSVPGPDGLITLSAVEGTITIRHDMRWDALEVTPKEEADTAALGALSAYTTPTPNHGCPCAREPR